MSKVNSRQASLPARLPLPPQQPTVRDRHRVRRQDRISTVSGERSRVRQMRKWAELRLGALFGRAGGGGLAKPQPPAAPCSAAALPSDLDSAGVRDHLERRLRYLRFDAQRAAGAGAATLSAGQRTFEGVDWSADEATGLLANDVQRSRQVVEALDKAWEQAKAKGDVATLGQISSAAAELLGPSVSPGRPPHLLCWDYNGTVEIGGELRPGLPEFLGWLNRQGDLSVITTTVPPKSVENNLARQRVAFSAYYGGAQVRPSMGNKVYAQTLEAFGLQADSGAAQVAIIGDSDTDAPQDVPGAVFIKNSARTPAPVLGLLLQLLDEQGHGDLAAGRDALIKKMRDGQVSVELAPGVHLECVLYLQETKALPSEKGHLVWSIGNVRLRPSQNWLVGELAKDAVAADGNDALLHAAASYHAALDLDDTAFLELMQRFGTLPKTARRVLNLRLDRMERLGAKLTHAIENAETTLERDDLPNILAWAAQVGTVEQLQAVRHIVENRSAMLRESHQMLVEALREASVQQGVVRRRLLTPTECDQMLDQALQKQDAYVAKLQAIEAGTAARESYVQALRDL